MKSVYRVDEGKFLFDLINQMIECGAYVKKFSEYYRVMDSNHNPIINISLEEHIFLLESGVIAEVWPTFVSKNPFASPHEISINNKIKQDGSRNKKTQQRKTTNRNKGSNGLRNKSKGDEPGDTALPQLSIFDAH